MSSEKNNKLENDFAKHAEACTRTKSDISCKLRDLALLDIQANKSKTAIPTPSPLNKPKKKIKKMALFINPEVDPVDLEFPITKAELAQVPNMTKTEAKDLDKRWTAQKKALFQNINLAQSPWGIWLKHNDREYVKMELDVVQGRKKLYKDFLDQHPDSTWARERYTEINTSEAEFARNLAEIEANITELKRHQAPKKVPKGSLDAQARLQYILSSLERTKMAQYVANKIKTGELHPATLGVLAIENKFDQTGQSNAGAYGIAQIMADPARSPIGGDFHTTYMMFRNGSAEKAFSLEVPDKKYQTALARKDASAMTSRITRLSLIRDRGIKYEWNKKTGKQEKRKATGGDKAYATKILGLIEKGFKKYLSNPQNTLEHIGIGSDYLKSLQIQVEKRVVKANPKHVFGKKTRLATILMGYNGGMGMMSQNIRRMVKAGTDVNWNSLRANKHIPKESRTYTKRYKDFMDIWNKSQNQEIAMLAGN